MYKLELSDLYAAFVNSGKFAESLKEIPNEIVKNAVFQHGIGDNLDRSPSGIIFYDFESGGLIEKEIQDILNLLDEESYRENSRSIGFLAEAYAEWASSMEEKIDRIFQLESQMETLAEIDRTAQEYQALLLGYAQKIGSSLA